MSKRQFLHLCILSALTILISLGARAWAAEESVPKNIHVDIEAPFEPAALVGLILTTKGSIEQPVSNFKRAKPGIIVAAVPYHEEELPRDAMVTAVAMSAQGEVAFGNVRPIFSPDSRDSFSEIPQCTPQRVSKAALEGQLSLLESIVEVRAQRRGVLQVQIAQTMTDEFVARLNKLERGFGLSRPADMRSDMNAVELVDRLSRLLEAMKTYQNSIKKSEAKQKAKK